MSSRSISCVHSATKPMYIKTTFKNNTQSSVVCILPRDVLFFDSVESRLLPKEVVLGRWVLGVKVFFPFPSLSFFLFSVNIPDISSSTYGRESLWAKLSWDRDFCLLEAWLNTGHFSVSWFIWRKKGWKLFHTLFAYPLVFFVPDHN